MVKYYSSDKLYNAKESVKTNDGNNKRIFLFVILSVTFFLSLLILLNSVRINIKTNTYKETGNVDYSVYLKENKYYSQKYLKSGMQYLGSIINTINVNYNYQANTDLDLNYKYRYRLVSNIQISDNSTSRLLYNNSNVLKDYEDVQMNNGSISINVNENIPYDQYNTFYNNYKNTYKLNNISGKIVLNFEIQALGNINNKINKNNVLTLEIPLGVVKVNINNKGIINSSTNIYKSTNITIINLNTLIISFIIFVITTILLIKLIINTIKSTENNAYNVKLKRILRKYDKRIVDGKLEIDESNYKNKVIITNFGELLDASNNTNEPILFYEVIPNEKSFFIVLKGDTIYKYRLTKAYLEKELERKKKKN